MTGKEFAEIILNDPSLSSCNISRSLVYLLKNRLIFPSDILDQYQSLMNDELHKAKSHFHEACFTTHQLLSGNFKGDDLEKVKKRASYNISFGSVLPYSPIALTEDELDEFRKEFFNRYDIDLGR